MLLKNLISISNKKFRSIEIKTLALDSRKVKNGSLFFAIDGDKFNGKDFIKDAINNGAAAVICSSGVKIENKNFPIIKVKNCKKALSTACKFFFKNKPKNIIAVTGTNGKTTTVTLLHNLFRMLDRKAGLIGTVENRIIDKVVQATHTTPDALSLQKLFREMVDLGCKFCFIEASSHAIDQNRLSGTKISGAVFTNITHDHLDYHKTIDNYIVAKKKLFDMLPINAFALVNSDDNNHQDITTSCKANISTYGIASIADIKGRIVENQLHGLHVHIDGQDLYSRLVGEFNASNLLAVYGVAKLLGFDALDTLTQMSLLKSPAGRFELVESPDGITAIVDYAHTPDALENILKTVLTFKKGQERIITVVGCGGDRDVTKRPIMAHVAATDSDRVFLTSDNPRTEDPAAILEDMKSGLDPIEMRKCISIADRKEAIRAAALFAEPGDIVIVAGKGHETYQEINGVKHDFDDRVVLREAFITA